jgi:hypothetical protein
MVTGGGELNIKKNIARLAFSTVSLKSKRVTQKE